MNSRVQIVATIGPASNKLEILKPMIEAGMDIARINFTWIDLTNDDDRIMAIRTVAKECGRIIPIIADLPGPRVQEAGGHTYNPSPSSSLTTKDEEMLKFCVENEIEYVALSFVANVEDITRYRNAIKKYGGTQKIIAKIERRAAVDALDEIISAADAAMVARGDLGKEVPLEEIPFIQKAIITKANIAHKPVITATQMMFSMIDHKEPTRAEVADVEEAVASGSDAVMLSEETASGQFPVEAVTMMERVITATERHYAERSINTL